MDHHFFELNFCPKFDWLIWCFVQQIYCFLIFHYYTFILISRWSIIFYLSFGDIYLCLGISLLFSFEIVSEIFCCDDFFENFVIFYVPLLYYFNLKSSIIFFSGDIHLSLGISWSCSCATDFELFCYEFFKTFVILSSYN